jgi:hypothetical protein
MGKHHDCNAPLSQERFRNYRVKSKVLLKQNFHLSLISWLKFVCPCVRYNQNCWRDTMSFEVVVVVAAVVDAVSMNKQPLKRYC